MKTLMESYWLHYYLSYDYYLRKGWYTRRDCVCLGQDLSFFTRSKSIRYIVHSKRCIDFAFGCILSNVIQKSKYIYIYNLYLIFYHFKECNDVSTTMIVFTSLPNLIPLCLTRILKRWHWFVSRQRLIMTLNFVKKERRS